MATLQQAKKVAEKFKATLVDDKSGNHHECRCEAPKGFVWKCDGTIHELIDSCYRPWKPDYQDLIDRMNYGIEKCEEINCEWCNEA